MNFKVSEKADKFFNMPENVFSFISFKKEDKHIYFTAEVCGLNMEVITRRCFISKEVIRTGYTM